MVSQAYIDFDTTLHMVDALILLESRYRNPPTSKSLHIIEGLRGGAAVLMVAAFESFLKSMVEELLYDFSSEPLKFNVATVPEAMRLYNIEKMLYKAQQSLKGADKALKIATYQLTANAVVSGKFEVEGFSNVTRSNPNPDRIKELFSSFGITDFFNTIKPEFEVAWGTPVAHTFIQDTLKSTVDRRHQVAHTASVLSVTRSDLEHSLRFLRIFANVCDSRLSSHLSRMLLP